MGQEFESWWGWWFWFMVFCQVAAGCWLGLRSSRGLAFGHPEAWPGQRVHFQGGSLTWPAEWAPEALGWGPAPLDVGSLRRGCSSILRTWWPASPREGDPAHQDRLRCPSDLLWKLLYGQFCHILLVYIHLPSLS